MLYKKERAKFLEWRETIITAFFAVCCLLLLSFFPAAEPLQSFTRSLFFLLIIPVLYIKFILKKPLASFGLTLKNNRAGSFWALTVLLVSLISFFLLARFVPTFLPANALPSSVAGNFWLFLFYELILLNSMLFLQQFFLQGFLLFSFREKIGAWSALLSFATLLIFLLLDDAVSLASLPFLIFFLTGSFATYVSRSFIYTYIAGLLFFIVTHAYLIYISQ